ncbi:hypothetical protein GCM10010975_24410 [Comamonas phosphati]|nr:hypothetical protein GCM10010975_24410 [Comamonas phosphati]
MKEILSTYPVAVWSIVSILLAAIVISALWDKVKWWWMNTWYSFPLIGHVARLSRDVSIDHQTGAFQGDLKLCRDYKKFIQLRNEHDFNEKISYLTKAGDLGRSGTPIFIWLLTTLLVFVEAMGFSYVLAGYTIPGASENTQQMGALGIAFLISVLLVALTHFSGHELYRSGKIKQARRSWLDAGRKHDLFTREVALATPQSVDDQFPIYTQLVNRVGAHPQYAITIATVIFVAVVAVGATFVRGKVLEKMLTQEVAGLNLSQAGSAGNGELKLDALVLPAHDQAQVQDSKDKVLHDTQDLDRSGGWGTFIVLAVIFVFLQFLGVLFGYKWGFAGKQSAAAFQAIGKGRFTSYEDVRAHYRNVADAAQAQLSSLDQRRQESGSSGTSSAAQARKMSFKDFMDRERNEDVRDLNSQHQHTQAYKPVPPAETLAAAPATDAPVASVPESEDDELARLERELAERRDAAQRRAKIEQMKKELASLEGNQP